MAHDQGRHSRVILGFNVQGDLGPLTMYTSKRKKMVAFLRAPPLNPPSPIQRYLRDTFREAARQWRAQGAPNRSLWNTAVRRANLGLSGYNLWVWFSRTRNHAALTTIERQSGITLPRPP
jgi:hypothetical protein